MTTSPYGFNSVSGTLCINLPLLGPKVDMLISPLDILFLNSEGNSETALTPIKSS